MNSAPTLARTKGPAPVSQALTKAQRCFTEVQSYLWDSKNITDPRGGYRLTAPEARPELGCPQPAQPTGWLYPPFPPSEAHVVCHEMGKEDRSWSKESKTAKSRRYVGHVSKERGTGAAGSP